MMKYYKLFKLYGSENQSEVWQFLARRLVFLMFRRLKSIT